MNQIKGVSLRAKRSNLMGLPRRDAPRNDCFLISSTITWDFVTLSSTGSQDRLIRIFSPGNPELLLHLQDFIGGLDDCIRIEGDTLNTTSHQKLGKFRIVAGSLTADTNLPPILFGPLNDQLAHLFHRRIPFIEDMRNLL